MMRMRVVSLENPQAPPGLFAAFRGDLVIVHVDQVKPRIQVGRLQITDNLQKFGVGIR